MRAFPIGKIEALKLGALRKHPDREEFYWVGTPI